MQDFSDEPRRALITGITGQDGSYLTELLLSKGYIVHGIMRRSSSFNTERIDHLYKVTTFLFLVFSLFSVSSLQDFHEESRLRLHYGDLSDGTVLRRIVEQVRPHEVYNLAAQSHVRVSFLEP